MSLLIHQSDFVNFSDEVDNLTLKDFEEAVNIVLRDPKAKFNTILYKLLSKVQSASANVQGSRAALKHRRNDIRAYTIYFGAPHFFITINPADIHSPLLLKIGGVKIQPELLGRRYEFRAKFLKDNPVLQAIYFDIIIKNVIKFLLGFDKKNNVEGILGYIKAYYGCVETQDRGSLHLHMLVWVLGGLNPSEFKEKLKLTKFKTALLKYLDSIIHCDFNGLIESAPLASTNDIHPCCKSPDYITKDMRSKKNLDEFLNDVYEVGKESAIHTCKASCFKYGSDECRHGFGLKNVGKALRELSIIDEHGNIHMKRAHAFVNDFHWVMQAGVRCNHDIKFIGKSISSSLACIYYVTNYVTKNGISSYNSLLFSLMAFQKIEKYEREPTSSNEKTKKLLLACYNAAANHTEYSGALVCNMLMKNGNDGTYYSSHETKVLNLFSFIKELNLNDGCCDIGDNLVHVDQIFNRKKHGDIGFNKIMYDYQLRSVELDTISLYTFISSYKKQKIISNRKKTIKSYSFCAEHYQYGVQELVQMAYDVVPLLLCPTIPRKEDNENKTDYAKMILLLFKSWRELSKIKDEGSNWEECLVTFVSNASPWILKLIDNIECLKKSQDDAEEEKKCIAKKPKQTFTCDNIEDQSDNNDDFVLDNQESDEENLEDELNLIKCNSDLLLDVNNEKLNTPYITDACSIVTNLMESQLNLNQMQFDNLNKNCHSHSFIKSCDVADEQNIKLWQDTYKNANKLLDEPDPFDFADSCVQNIISIEGESDYLNEFSVSDEPITNDIEYSEQISYKEIIAKYSLNEKQQIAFFLFVEPVFNTEKDQRLIYMSGEGGTGKSQVILAIINYFALNNRSKSLLVSAPTGSAACLINGNINQNYIRFSLLGF